MLSYSSLACKLFTVFVIALSGCKTTSNSRITTLDQPKNQIQTDSKPVSKDSLIVELPDVNPENCRIVGELIHIYPASPRKPRPCNQYPCLGKIKIKKIEERGFSFQGNINNGDTINVSFKFSLSPTKEALPNLDFTLPGIELYQTFRADIESSLPLLANPSSQKFKIGKYKIIST